MERKEEDDNDIVDGGDKVVTQQSRPHPRLMRPTEGTKKTCEHSMFR